MNDRMTIADALEGLGLIAPMPVQSDVKVERVFSDRPVGYGSVLLREETFYLPTYITDDRGLDATGEASLFTRRFRLTRTRKGNVKLTVWQNVEAFPDDDAMVAAIEERGLTELPKEAEADPLFVPDSWAGR